jgi:hypothetical protein
MNYPEAVVIDIGDNLEPSIEAEVVGIDNTPHWDMAQRKLMCCLSISIVVFIMIVLGYSLSRS